jgi:6-phosphogluconolactonase
MSSTTDQPMQGAVLVQSNEHSNRLIAFRRDEDGALSPGGAVETRGAGNGTAHLQSQGSVTITGDGGRVLVTNAGSGDLSMFSVGTEGLIPRATMTTGQVPTSVAEHDGLVYVLHAGEPSVTAFRFGEGGLTPLEGSTRSLAAGADPAQVGFSPDGRVLVVTERGTNTIVAFPVEESGQLGEPAMTPSSGPTPYGFAFSGTGVLVVTEAFGAQVGKAAASSYMMNGALPSPVSRSVGNGRSEICWAAVTADGRYAFTTNFADGAVSRYDIDDGGALRLGDATAGVSVDGRTGLRDLGLSWDSRFLYALDADSGQIHGWSVDAGGALTTIGSWGGLPLTAGGLAVA